MVKKRSGRRSKERRDAGRIDEDQSISAEKATTRARNEAGKDAKGPTKSTGGLFIARHVNDRTNSAGQEWHSDADTSSLGLSAADKSAINGRTSKSLQQVRDDTRVSVKIDNTATAAVLKGKNPVEPGTEPPHETHLIPHHLSDFLDHPGPSNWASRLEQNPYESALYCASVRPGDQTAQEELCKVARGAKAEYNSCWCKHPTQNCEWVSPATLEQRKKERKGKGGLFVRWWRGLKSKLKKKKTPEGVFTAGKRGSLVSNIKPEADGENETERKKKPEIENAKSDKNPESEEHGKPAE